MKWLFILFILTPHLLFSYELTGIEVFPREIKLTGKRATAQILVTGLKTDGSKVDLTDKVTYNHSGNIAVKNGLVSVLNDGESTVSISYGKFQKAINVFSEDTGKNKPVSFRWETLAVLTKQGCNGGGCHGKPNGRGALELSLNAFDPAFDEKHLIKGAMGRFIQPMSPKNSLLLKKPTLDVGHVGGKRLKKDSLQYEIIKQWIKEGAQADKGNNLKCVKVEVTPSQRIIYFPDNTQQISVRAHFSDGSVKDVTRIATYTLSNTKVAVVDEYGLVKGLERGQTAVNIRYLDDVITVNLTFVKDIKGFVWKKQPEHNYIDRLVNKKLKQLQYQAADTCDDSTFIRRLSLDVRGLLPHVDEVKKFLKSNDPDKRSLLIEKFLKSEDFTRFWGMKMADLLRINTEMLTKENAAKYSRWVYGQVKDNVPYDSFAKKLLLAKGNTDYSPPANFYKTMDETNSVTESVAQLFMGTRLQCAQCHNHPYESWTQDNYYQIGAAFNNIDRKLVIKSEDQRKQVLEVTTANLKKLENPRTGISQDPWPVDIKRDEKADSRKAFVEWLTTPGNPYFARVEVNRIWAHLMGRGIVMPVDDFRPSNPASNRELLDALAVDFEKSGFDRLHIIKAILNSQTYQRTSETNKFNEKDEELFSHAKVRILSAEQMQDAVASICDPKFRDIEKIRKDLEEKQHHFENLREKYADHQKLWEKNIFIDPDWNTQEPVTAFEVNRKIYQLEKSGNAIRGRSGTWLHVRSFYKLSVDSISAVKMILEMDKRSQGLIGRGPEGNAGTEKSEFVIVNKGLTGRFLRFTSKSHLDLKELQLIADGQILAGYEISSSNSKQNDLLTDNKLQETFKTENRGWIEIDLKSNRRVDIISLYNAGEQVQVDFMDSSRELIYSKKLSGKQRIADIFTGGCTVPEITAVSAYNVREESEVTKSIHIELNGRWKSSESQLKTFLNYGFRSSVKVPEGSYLMLTNMHWNQRGSYSKHSLAVSQMANAVDRIAIKEYAVPVIQIPSKKRNNWEDKLVQNMFFRSIPEVQEAMKLYESALNKIENHFITQKMFPKKSEFLAAFGQPERNTVCACERPDEINLDQIIQLMNGDFVKRQIQKISRHKIISPDEEIERIYLSAFCRLPTAEEKRIGLSFLKASPNKSNALADLYWAVINSNEFIFQH